jgi:chromosome segregation ATPase
MLATAVLRAALSDRQADVERMRQQLADANRRCRLAPTPQGYLIEQLEAAELQAKQQAARAEAAARDASNRQAALEASQQQLRMLRADLERLLQQRGSIDALRNTLSSLL